MRNKQITASLEDYLETVYYLWERNNSVKAVEIAKKLNVSRASVTEALNNLSEKKLINYGRYSSISFTPNGLELAKKISQRHKILSRFFTDILGVAEDEAEETACKIEHVITDNILDRITALVEFSNADKTMTQAKLKDFQKMYEEK